MWAQLFRVSLPLKQSRARCCVAGKQGLVTDGMYRGTDEYMAPEVSAGKESYYGIAADIWSLGVMTYELMFGRLCKPERDSFTRRLVEAVGLPCFLLALCAVHRLRSLRHVHYLHSLG